MIQLGLLTAAIAAVLIGPEIAAHRRKRRQAQQDDAALRAKLATMPGSEWVANYPGPLPPMVAAIAAGEVALWPMPGDDPWVTMSGPLPAAMQDPDVAEDTPWSDRTVDWRDRMKKLGEQYGEGDQ